MILASNGEVFQLADLVAPDSETPSAWREFLRRDSMSAGIYRLQANEPDRQSPHTEDEIYHVLEGHGVVEIAAERAPVVRGDTIFVARGVAHRFHDYPEGITLLVFFAPAQGSAAAKASATGSD